MSENNEKRIKKIWINPGCVSCGACQFIAPEVFVVDQICKVIPDANLIKFEREIRLAVSKCPAGVIKLEEVE